MKEVEFFVGPCSKFITGEGWVTEIPVEQLKAKGYVKNITVNQLEEKNRLLKDANETINQNIPGVGITIKYFEEERPLGTGGAFCSKTLREMIKEINENSIFFIA